VGIFASQFLVPFSDKEHREEGHGVKVSGSYVVPGFYEFNREVLKDNDIKNCAQRVNLLSILKNLGGGQNDY
jgi:hypothetical protein